MIKNIIKIWMFGCIGLLGLNGCNDSFLEKYPETSITEDGFFNNASDLEAYTNGLYENIVSGYMDVPSDNVVSSKDETIYRMMRGEVNPDNRDVWDWKAIRNVNFMLARAGKAVGDEAEINHYIGLARMFRAKLYYDQVLAYSDVPWYSRDLQTTDTELLYKTQDPRSLVVDSIMADLDFAVNNMQDGAAAATRWYKNGALAIQARIALSEGCWRKYHPELNLDDSERFLQIAIDACRKVMDSGLYDLTTAKSGEIEAYEALFCSQDLSNNKEMIIYEDYDLALGRLHNAGGGLFDFEFGLSRDLMEDYLVIEDGKTKRFQDVPGYATKKFTEIFENRDPRMRQTFMVPGFIRANVNEPHRPKLTMGGYTQVKFSPRTADQITYGKSYTDLPLIRYAEILLMYAEAKAELGELTQDDVDRTINLLRDRVGMPRASLADWLSNIDPVQANRYSNVSSLQKGAVYEVRRERRIELACEGFRKDDLRRWGCGKLFEHVPEGVYLETGYLDVTGDGQPDYAIVATQADADAIPQADKDKYNLQVEVLDGNTYSLTDGNKGYIRMVSQIGRWTFVDPKYYYTPLATKDLIYNPNLVQNKYWAE
ncbi:RagB/SusD family nutrient uptake outer membrane protein [uncultured Parabacteroides sp.]|uniref:RagB/SusD family nutrient uptake outer membrane protein n=2 Tax=Parabacteroides TaxID=375288 RepID=UPI00265A92CF|nr:RagB/SusD family nutrient uptake outer membrane protein [uncultured Parabacteroides sp.]